MLNRTRLGVVQLGQTSPDKQFNLKHAREAVLKAASQGPLSGADMVILPECFNSPYGVHFFDKYAEALPGLFEQVKQGGTATTFEGETQWAVDNKDNAHPITPSQDLLSASESVSMVSSAAKEAGVALIGGRIPERHRQGTLYHTSLVFDKEGRIIAMHRKIHLFDIDIPGKMTFQESETLTAGKQITVFDCGTC